MREETILSYLWASTIWNKLAIEYGTPLKEFMYRRVSILLGMKEAKIRFEPRGEEAYTSGIGVEKFLIVIGGELCNSMAGVARRAIDKMTARKCARPIARAIYATMMHELAHDMFTDMEDRSIAEYKKEEYRKFMHTLFNILEDVTIEYLMGIYIGRNYPGDKALFGYDLKTCFKIDNVTVIKEWAAKYEDHGDAESFMNYMLAHVKAGRKYIKGTCKAWEDHKEGIIAGIKKVITTDDPTERIHASIEFGEWLIENIPEIDFREIKGTGGPGGTPRPIKGRGKGKKITEYPMPPIGPGGPIGPEEPPVEPPIGPEKGPKGPKGEEIDIGEKEEGEDIVEHPEDDLIDEELINDDMDAEGRHVWIKASEEFEIPESVEEEIEERLEKYSGVANETSKYLKLVNGRKKPRESRGYRSGRPDINKILRQEVSGGRDLSLFSRSIARGKQTDVCFYLVGDNSGSMSGIKSQICCNAMLALANACDMARVPLAVSCFTKTDDSMTGVCQTIVEKDFEESFEGSKKYFGINDSSIVERMTYNGENVTPFCGNAEEVNLYHIYKSLQKVRHEKKVLIVLCDGCTCGDRSRLKSVCKMIEDDPSMILIGVGIKDTGVETYYSRNVVFKTTADMEERLPQFLVDTLAEFTE